MSSGLCHGLSSVSAESFHLTEARFWCFDIRSVPLVNSGGSVLPTFNGVMVI